MTMTFLDLPREVRNMIYDELLVSSATSFEILYPADTVAHAPDQFRQAYSASVATFKEHMLAWTCRQVRGEYIEQARLRGSDCHALVITCKDGRPQFFGGEAQLERIPDDAARVRIYVDPMVIISNMEEKVHAAQQRELQSMLDEGCFVGNAKQKAGMCLYVQNFAASPDDPVFAGLDDNIKEDIKWWKDRYEKEKRERTLRWAAKPFKPLLAKLVKFQSMREVEIHLDVPNGSDYCTHLGHLTSELRGVSDHIFSDACPALQKVTWIEQHTKTMVTTRYSRVGPFATEDDIPKLEEQRRQLQPKLDLIKAMMQEARLKRK